MVDKYPNPAAAFRDVYEQYVEEASFLWQMRSIAVDQPHYTRQDLARLENRLQAQLNGLMSAPDMAWEVCEQALELGGPGEVFVATYIAVKTHVQARIQQAVEAGLATPEAFSGLVSVFGWLPQELSYPWIQRFLNSKDLQHKHLAMAICSIRRENPGEFLNRIFQRDDCRQHPALLGRAVRIVGELGRNDLQDQIRVFRDSDDPDTQFWAHWSSILLGDRSAAVNMQDFVFQPGPHQKQAIDIVFRSLAVNDAREWISRMAELPEQQRSIVQAVGTLGDPHAVDWLIGKTQLPELSRLAGEAFTSISGIDLEANQLALEDNQPEMLTSTLDDENSDQVEMDDDENLPWPDHTLLAQYWVGIRGRFQEGQRYLLGMPIEHLNAEMASSPLTQRQLRAIAMELALKTPGQGLVNVSGKVI